jgi:hypothetical protein
LSFDHANFGLGVGCVMARARLSTPKLPDKTLDSFFWVYTINCFLMMNNLNALTYFLSAIVAILGFEG